MFYYKIVISFFYLFIWYCHCLGNISKKLVSLEKTSLTSEVIFHGKNIPTSSIKFNHSDDTFETFQLINAYKGAKALGLWSTNNQRKIKVKVPLDLRTENVPVEYILFCNVNNKILKTSLLIKWDENVDQRIWTTLGWSKWSDWTPCSVTCSSGIQVRTRKCLKEYCPGFNIEQRYCNLFGCEKAINLLALDKNHYIQPSEDLWPRQTERPTAWRFDLNNYVFISSKELYIKNNTNIIKNDFTIFLTFRKIKDCSGTLFSLRSRTIQTSYSSLEIVGSNLKFIHSSPNGTNIIRIPLQFLNKKWYQVTLSIEVKGTIKIFVDCNWILTYIGKNDNILLTEDADITIGYLFIGYLEQMSVSTEANISNLQCSNTKASIIDFSIES